MRVARAGSRARRTKAFRLRHALLVVVLTTGAVLAALGSGEPAGAVGSYNNAAIADRALTFVDQPGGQCWQFVRDVVHHVSGGCQDINAQSGNYFQHLEGAGGDRITDVNALSKGDVVQIGANGGHTFIIVSRVGGNTFNVVDSNHAYNEVVMNYDRTVTLSDSVRAYRMGTLPPPTTTTTTPPPPPDHTYNSDVFSDLAILHEVGVGGIDAHVLWGSVGIPFQTNMLARSLASASGWNWDQVKTAVGEFNGDTYDDIALVHQLGDDGADVHILYGGYGTPFTYADTFARRLPASEGWRWSQMKVEAGKYNSDVFSDLAILHEVGGGGIDIHVLWGGNGIPFQTNMLARSLPSSTGWNWQLVKTSTGRFNGDTYDDIALVHQLGDDGADVHILYGGYGTPFTYADTFARRLPASEGWRWSQMKVEAGKYNSDVFSDLAILHEVGGGGIDVHVLWGSVGIPFQTNMLARSLPSSTGWNWQLVKASTGRFNGDTYDDIALVHQLGDDGADVHILYGGYGTPFTYADTFARRLPASEGWRWSQMKVEASG